MNCDCEIPRDGKHGHCVACGLLIDPDVLVTDETHVAFLDRLRDALQVAESWPDPNVKRAAGLDPYPEEWEHFRYMCLQREREGRKRWGVAHLSRDNVHAGWEEGTDACNYAYFDVLQSEWLGRDPDMDLVLKAAYHDFMAYSARLQIRAKRLGTP